MSNYDQELQQAQAKIRELQAEIEAKKITIQEQLVDIRATLIDIAKHQRILELGESVLATSQFIEMDPQFIWSRLEAAGEKAARWQSELLEGLSPEEVLQEARRQQQQLEAYRLEKKRRRRRRRR